jgi:hypothetical protein
MNMTFTEQKDHQEFNAWSATFKFILIVVVVLGYLLLAFAAEASELRLGAGKNHGSLIGDGVWQQSGVDNKIENDQPAYSLTYIGNTHTGWLDYGLGLHYLRGPVASGEFLTYDECYNNRQYSGGHNGSCDKRDYASSVSSETFAVSFTINPTWRVNRDTALSAAIGGRFFHTVQRVEFDRSRGRGPSLDICDEAAKYRETGITPYAELSVTFKKVFATAYYAKDEGAAQAMSDANYGLMVGYRHQI